MLKGERTYVEMRTVSNVIVPFPLLEFIKQEIVLAEKTKKNCYNYFYSFTPRMNKGEIYKFTILPNSNIILDAEATNDNLQMQ